MRLQKLAMESFGRIMEGKNRFLAHYRKVELIKGTYTHIQVIDIKKGLEVK